MAILQEKTYHSLSIVIATYNRTQKAIDLAKEISTIKPGIEIIIVDQLSYVAVKIESKNIKYFNLNIANLSAARNFGLNNSSGEIVLFLDDDVEITKDTIPSHLQNYDNTDVIGVAGRVINDGEKIPKNTDIETGKTNLLHTKFIQYFWSTKKQYVDFAYGCNMSYRRSALKTVVGFDEKFSKIFDEIDMGVRISKIGKIVFEPDALVYHHKAVSGGIRDEENKDKNKLVYYYYGYFMSKNVIFPFSLISLMMRTVTILREYPYSLWSLYKGYLNL